MGNRRGTTGSRAGVTLAVILVAAALAVLVALVVHTNHASAAHGQRIANCVVATGDTWAQCARLVGG